MITQTRLASVLHYSPRTGEFTWTQRTSNRVEIGQRAGHVDKINRYRTIRIDGVLYRASRLAWLYMTGTWPSPEVDHRNTIRDDDSWNNLRETTSALNKQNQRQARSDNRRTGILGVHPNGNGFAAAIQVDGIQHHLGTYSTKDAASAAYVAAKRRLHPGGTL